MAKKHLPNPPELTLLKTLWERGPTPVRRLHDLCAQNLNWTFSSTRKTLERMESKGFVSLQKREKSVATYTAKASKTTVLANMARDFMDRVLEIDGPMPLGVFANSKILSDEDLDELEGLLGR